MKRIVAWLKYSFLLVKRNAFLTILVILQLALTVFGVATLCRFSFMQGGQVKYAEQLADNGSVYSIIDREYIDQLKDVELEMNLLDAGANISGQSVIATTYTSRINDFIELPLYKGKWFDSSSDGLIQIVASQSCGLSLNEKVTIKFLNKSVSGIIVGILPKKATVFRIGGGSTSADNIGTDNLFRGLDEKEKIIFFSREQMIANGLEASFGDSNAYYIRFKDGISEENLQYNHEILRNNGSSTVTIDKIISNTERDSNMLLMMFVPIVVLLVAMILLSTLMVVLLISYSSKKLLSTIYLYGAYESDVYGMMFLLGLIMTVVADVIYFIADKLLMGEFIINFGSDYRHLIAVFLINIVQVGLITLLSKKAIKKKNMLSSLREEL